ncbi:MAG: wax ester/triacylglycerol synthase family O-acyltransferase [Burkholderiaceae bacterium]
MEHLSGVDATFLHLESPEMPMHVAGLYVMELPEGYQGDFYEDVKAHVARRMHLVPVFERKLAQIPFELANPVWVHDDDIDLDYHVRRIILPRPGTMRQLEQYAARLHSSLLDQSRPLWEFYVFEGLEGGRVAYYGKVHHAAIDGQAGVALANAILDVSPVPRKVRPPRAHRHSSSQYQLGVAELAGAALSNTLRQAWRMVKLVPDVARVGIDLVRNRPGSDNAETPKPRRRGLTAPRTPFNVSITNQRAFATASIPLGETKAIAKATGTTLNDVVLATCAAALRRYLKDEGPVPAKPLVAGVPVSLREAGNTDMTNQVSGMLVSLATDIADPLERLQEIHRSSVAAKEVQGRMKSITPTDFPSLGVPWIVRGMANLYARSRLANTLPPVVSVAISNVPGPQYPLYLAGARLLSYYPVSAVAHGVALNITVQSYDGSLDYGVIACRRAVPDVPEIAQYLRDAHEELKALVLTPKAEGEAAATADVVPIRRARRAKAAAAAAPAAVPATARTRRSRAKADAVH